MTKNWRTVVILVYGTVALVLNHYNQFLPRREWDSLIFFLAIPLLLLALLRRPPAHYGFRLGNWRRGLLLTVGGWLVMAPILWASTRGADFHNYYAPIWREHGFWGTVLWAATDLFGWEFFFRGVLLYALAGIAGDWAILLQAMLFTLAHFGKPQVETLSCIVGGTAFGWVAWQTESFFYPFLIHLFVTVFTVWVAK